MLTDILHAFAQNPILPAYDPAWTISGFKAHGDEWVTLNEGIHTVGHSDHSFHFDNEKPAHRALVGPVTLGRNLVTNAEWLAFMERRRLRDANAMADGRLRGRKQRTMAGTRPLARDIEANGTS